MIVEVALCVVTGIAGGSLVALYDHVRARNSRPPGIAARFELFVDDAWHCATCRFLAMLKRSEYGREWRANILAAIDRGVPAHGPLDARIMREAPPLGGRFVTEPWGEAERVRWPR